MSSFSSKQATDLSRSFADQKSQPLLSLNADSLNNIDPNKLEVPSYPLSKRVAGIVHFGPSNFSAGHLGVYADDLLNSIHAENLREDKSNPLNCGIIAVTPRLRQDEKGNYPSRDRRSQLAKQDFLYTVVERDRTTCKARVIGSLMDIMIGPDDREAVYELLASPDTKLVTATVTQDGYKYKGYEKDHIAEYIVEGLRRRRERGLQPFQIMSCDNVISNTEKLMGIIDTYASEDQELRHWIELNTHSFNTMVDRIVPAGTQASRDFVRDNYGLLDNSVIATEPYKELVIGYSRKDRSEICIPFSKAGAQYSSVVKHHEDAKLGMLNGAHMFIGCVGRIAGHTHIEKALNDNRLLSLTREFMKQVQGTLVPMTERDYNQYAETLIERFRNPHPEDLLQRLARNGLTKIDDRIFKPLSVAYENNSSRSELLRGIASWVIYMAKANPDPSVTHDTEQGFFIEDEKAYKEAYVKIAGQLNGHISPMLSFELFSDLVDKPYGNLFREELQDSYAEALKGLGPKPPSAGHGPRL